MSSESELKEISQPTFWDNRYATSSQINDADNPNAEPTIESFEWFRSFSKIKHFLEKWLPKPGGSELILHLGCGNSVCSSWPFLPFLITCVQTMLEGKKVTDEMERL
jgi:hypothetical protein